MGRDLEWERLEYYWHYLPFGSRMKILGLAVKYHVAYRLRALSRFQWALAIEGIVILTLALLAGRFHETSFAPVAWIAIGVMVGGTIILWLFKDIPRE